MPAKNTFGQDRIALENAFFAEQNQKALQAMRDKKQRQATRESLATVSGISDDTLLDTLVDLEINSETLTAMQMIPLIAVAWADGKMDDAEREAILKAADAHGIDPETPEYLLLTAWLSAKPGGALLDAWTKYIYDICGTLEAAQREKLRDTLLAQVREVAAAAGGFLGLANPVSKSEQAMLDRLASAF